MEPNNDKLKAVTIDASMPLFVRIKNNTDETHYDIPVINPDYKSVESKYSYAGQMETIPYDFIVTTFNSMIGREVAMIYTSVEKAPNEEIVKEQVTAGFIVNDEVFPSPIDPHQHQKGITVMSKNFEITEGMKFNVPFLKPQVEILLHLFIKPIKP